MKMYPEFYKLTPHTGHAKKVSSFFIWSCLATLLLILVTLPTRSYSLASVGAEVSVSWLRNNLHKVKIIDIRTSNKYYRSRISGSINIPRRSLSWEDLANQLIENPRKKRAIKSLVTSHGVSPKKHIIIVSTRGRKSSYNDDIEFSYWTLKALGYPRISILKGGITNWNSRVSVALN